MKKLILIITIFGLFVLAGCDTPNTNVSTDSNTTNSNHVTTETKNKESDSSKTDEEKNDESKTSENNDNEHESTLPVYDDGGDWHGVID